MRKKKERQKTMSLIDHLEELRRRLIICGAAIFLAAMFSYLYVDRLREIFAHPVGNLVYLGLTEAFLTNMKLAFIAGFFLSLPVTFYQMWCFVLPGLHGRERRYLLFISIFSLSFFVLGVVFGFLVILPFSIRFFLGFASDQLQPMLSFSSYISYSMGLLMGFGLVFEMPVAILILAKLGLVSADYLARQRMYATIIIFILAAIFTPPDVVSQILMGLPMLLLYEFSILLARIVQPKENKKTAVEF
jgi:sec-independent protein translocase protein TatC